MSTFQQEILFAAIVTAVACSLPGVFLVLRRMAMMSDAISHVLLFGIVVSFMIVRNLHSPLLFVGATLSGVLTVALVELLKRTRLVREDAAIGLVFPMLFSIGVILTKLKARNIHLDADSVLLGMLEFAPYAEVHIGGAAMPFWRVVMIPALLLNVALIAVFYKELKLATFDAALAASLGFMPGLLHYLIMTSVSLTAVTAFDAVGPVLVVAFMVVPAATAYLLADRLSLMLVLSAVIAVAGAVVGCWISRHWEHANTAGMITVSLGVIFALTFLFSPRRGLLAVALRRHRQRNEFLQTMLTVHLLNHEGTAEQAEESRLSGLHEHLRWKPQQVERVVRWAKRGGLVEQHGEQLVLTDSGRARARELFGG